MLNVPKWYLLSLPRDDSYASQIISGFRFLAAGRILHIRFELVS